MTMFEKIQRINQKPQPFEFYTTKELWNDPYIFQQMLKFHLDENSELASRKKEFIDSSVEWMTEYFDINKQTKIIDFGCGPGLYTTPFAKRGAYVTGIDFSENSINYARKIAKENQLNIDYICESYLDFSTTEKFDLAIMIYCDFCVLSPAQREQLLRNIHKLLKDGGRFIFDVWSLFFFDEAEEKATYEYCPKDGFWSAKPYYAFMNTFKYDQQKLYLDKYTIIKENRTREIYNWLQCYSQQSIEDVLLQNGFCVDEIFSNVAGQDYNSDSKEIAVVAQKK